jgi:CBS domain-containing protein
MTIARLIAGRDQPIIHCSVRQTVREAAQLLAENRIGALPVLERDEVSGIFSERDVLHCVARRGEAALDLLVAEAMTAPPITAQPSTSVLDALGLMTRRRIRHLPVIDAGRMIAFVSIGDLVKYRLDLVEHEAQAMRDYIRTA